MKGNIVKKSKPADFELIASGETTEEVNGIVISQDNDGNPFELCDEIDIYAYCPKTSNSSTMSLSINLNNKLVAQTATNAINNTAQRYIQCRCVFTGAVWDCYSGSIEQGLGNALCGPQNAFNAASRNPAQNSVNQIKLYLYNAGNVLPVGFEYYIYGRRA